MTLSHSGVRVSMVFVYLCAVPLIHCGIPWLLSRWGSHWGWTLNDSPGVLNYTGALPIAGGVALLAWMLATALSEVPFLPRRVRVGLRPARLVESGPYAWTRHPMYLAELMLWLGVAILMGSAIVFAAIPVFVTLVLIVIPREEAALESFFGDQYREYRKRVPAFILHR